MRRAACLLLTLLLLPVGAASARDRWDTRVIAKVPLPGYPAHAYVHPNGLIYEGTYQNTSSALPSRVFEYTIEGTLQRSWTVLGQELDGEQGVQVATSDALGRLVLLDHSPPRALLLDRRDGSLKPYAEWPAGSVPNYAAWGPGGELYVTDYAQSVIWRVPPGGGTPEPWLRDDRLGAIEFGTTGLQLSEDGKTLLIGQQSAPGFGNVLTGALLSAAIGPDGKAGPLERVWESGPLDLPDGFAIGRSGRVYMAALGPNQIVVIGPDGAEQERFPPTPLTGENGSAIPFDALSSIAFRGTSLITASQSNPQGNADHWALHDVEAGEEGVPELIPLNAGLTASTRPALRVFPRRVKARRKARTIKLRVLVDGLGLRGATVRLGGRSVLTDATGRAAIRVKLRRRGVRRAVVSAPGLKSADAPIRIVR